MSNFHLLTQSERNKSINIIFHIPIPANGTNVADISWREAVVLEQGGASEIISVLPGISPAEDSDLKAGVIVEKQDNFTFSLPHLSNAERLQEIKDRFTALTTEFVEEKQKTLEFIGYEGDV